MLMTKGYSRQLAQRCEPQVPVKTRLVGSVDARGLEDILGFVTEWIRDPNLAVARTLKFDFEAGGSHPPKQAEIVRDAEGI